MKLTVLVVTWNSEADIADCLDAVSFAGTSETVVVDNDSRDGTRRLLEGRGDIRLITNRRNLGYARATNQGIELARGEYVLLLNPDAVPEPDALDLLVSTLDGHPEAGGAAARLLNTDGTTQHSIRSFPDAATLLWELTGFARLFPRSRRFGRWRMAWFDYDRPAEVDQPMASCLLVRRRVLRELGGLDESFPIFFNDVDLSRRMLQAGWKTLYVPDARVRHRRGASTSQARPQMITESHRSMFRYLRKHNRGAPFWMKAVALLPLLELSAVVRRVAYRLRRA